MELNAKYHLMNGLNNLKRNNMKKQTAVEMLVESLTELGVDLLSHNLEIQQAKAMEKQQHQKTAVHFFPTSLRKEYFEQYYNENYGN